MVKGHDAIPKRLVEQPPAAVASHPAGTATEGLARRAAGSILMALALAAGPALAQEGDAAGSEGGPAEAAGKEATKEATKEAAKEAAKGATKEAAAREAEPGAKATGGGNQGGNDNDDDDSPADSGEAKADSKAEARAEAKADTKADPKADTKAADPAAASGSAPPKADAAKADEALPLAGRETITKDSFRRIVGAEVRSANSGIVVATIANVLVDAKGKGLGAVLDYGGFMGVGKRRIAVAWSLLDFEGGKILLSLSRDQLREFPDFKDGEDAVLATLPAPPN